MWRLASRARSEDVKAREIKVGQRYRFDRKGLSFTAKVVHVNRGLVKFEDPAPSVGYVFLPTKCVKGAA